MFTSGGPLFKVNVFRWPLIQGNYVYMRWPFFKVSVYIR